jgi:WXXGXW repeat (2 copies)
MKTSWVPRAALAGLLLGTLCLGGCVVTPPRVYVGAAITVAPPAPRVEVIGVAPAPGYVWIGGYWNWVGERHVWVPGRWRPGRPGYYWVPHRWVAAGGGWRLEPGHWAR